MTQSYATGQSVTDAGWAALVALAAPIGTRPVRLDGPHDGHLVDGGEADVFAVHSGPEPAPARRHFVGRVPERSLVPGVVGEGAWRLELVPLPGTTLHGLTAA